MESHIEKKSQTINGLFGYCFTIANSGLPKTMF